MPFWRRKQRKKGSLRLEVYEGGFEFKIQRRRSPALYASKAYSTGKLVERVYSRSFKLSRPYSGQLSTSYSGQSTARTTIKEGPRRIRQESRSIRVEYHGFGGPGRVLCLVTKAGSGAFLTASGHVGEIFAASGRLLKLFPTSPLSRSVRIQPRRQRLWLRGCVG